MSNLFQQIVVIMVLLIIGTVIISVSTGENKAKKIINFVKEKKKNKPNSECKIESKPDKKERTVTTVIKKKNPATVSDKSDVWYVLVRDKSNKYTIKKSTFTLSQLIEAPFTIGRGEDVNLKITNELISEEHAMIIYDDESESVVFIDTGSTNGSYVNSFYDSDKNYCEGERIETAEIEDGLTVFLWDTPIIFSRTSSVNKPKVKNEDNSENVINTKVYNK